MLYIFELVLYFYSTATKSSIKEFEEIKSREFSADVYGFYIQVSFADSPWLLVERSFIKT